MYEHLYDQIKQHAIDEYPNEACGFIVDDQYIRIGNISLSPDMEFEIPLAAQIQYGHVAQAFIHSHPDWHPCPSESDMKHQMASALPWGIISTDGERATPITWFGDQVPTPPLVGRGFIHGVQDCYEGIRDWYWVHKQKRLKQFPRSWEWWYGEQDLYQIGFAQAGFVEVSQEEIEAKGPQVGDVALAIVGRSKKINHGGVYVGNGLLFHHMSSSTHPVDMSRLSVEEPINRWMKYITLWVRYAA